MKGLPCPASSCTHLLPVSCDVSHFALPRRDCRGSEDASSCIPLTLTATTVLHFFVPGRKNSPQGTGWAGKQSRFIFSTLRAKTDKCMLQSGRRPVFTIRTCKSFLPSGGPRIDGGFSVTLTLTLTCDWEIRTVERCECLRVDKFTRERMSASFTGSPGGGADPAQVGFVGFLRDWLSYFLVSLAVVDPVTNLSLIFPSVPTPPPPIAFALSVTD